MFILKTKMILYESIYSLLINCTSVDISTMPSCSGTSYMIKAAWSKRLGNKNYSRAVSK